MRRALWSLLLLLPLSLHAQDGRERAPFTVSAFTGVRVPFTGGAIAVYDEEGALIAAPRQERSGNPVLGLQGSMPMVGRFSMVAAGVYSSAGQGSFFLTDSVFGQAPDFGVRYLSGMLFGKVGVQARFEAPPTPGGGRPLPSTDLTVGAALVRELGSTHPAVNAGFQGTLPIGRRLQFTLGLEDYLVFWDKQSLEADLEGVLRRLHPEGGPVTAGLLYDTSNILLLRAGLALRY